MDNLNVDDNENNSEITPEVNETEIPSDSSESQNNNEETPQLGNGYNPASSNREAFQRGLNTSYKDRIAANQAKLAQARARSNQATKQNEAGEEKDKNLLDKAKDKVNVLNAKKSLLSSKIDSARAKAYQAMHPVEAAKMMAKQKAKALLMKFLIAAAPYLLIFFLILFVILAVAANDSGDSGSSGSNVVYASEYNYEETTVTVMDGDNTSVLATTSLEDYILGVLCPEIGACSGNVSNLEEHYIKTKIIASKTYVLARSNYSNATKQITIKASTRDQQWCDLENGCIVTKTDDLVPGYQSSYFYNTYPGNYTGTIDGTITQRYNYTEEDLTILHQYYSDTYGELFLSNDYNDVITSLNGSDATEYKAGTQNYWNEQAKAGKTYVEILINTASSGVADSEDYANKSIYKLSDYVEIIDNGSSGLDEAEGDIIYNDGGIPLPMYYQQDYPDVMLASAVPSKNWEAKYVAKSGCGFTSSSMIVSYLLDKKITPREFVDDWSRKYYVRGKGMSHDLPAAAAKHYGLGEVKKVYNINEAVEALRNGHPVMSSQGPGLFTKQGHLIVLRGVTSDGKILVNDPNKNNAINKGYNNRAFTVDEIKKSGGTYFIWPKKLNQSNGGI